MLEVDLNRATCCLPRHVSVQVFSMGDSFDVRDATGQPAFRLQGAAMSMREVSI